MPELVNPLAGYRDAYNLLEGQAQDGARRQAGNALAGGNYQGAQDALYGRGMIDEGMGVQQRQMALQDRESGQQAAQAEAAKKAMAESYTMIGQAAQGLTRVPAEQRRAYLDSTIIPTLRARGTSEDVIAVLSDPSHDLSDESLRAFVATLGQEATKFTGVPLGGGGYGAFDPMAGTLEVLREPVQEPDDAPTGYRWTESGDLAVIRGGPADPRVAGQLAGSKRAPPRPRSGGGGGSASALTTEQLMAIAKGG